MRLWPRVRVDEGLLDLLEEAARNAQRTSLLVRDLMVDYPEKAGLAHDVLIAEHEGDRITHDILHRLNGGRRGRLPIASEDVHALASALDDVVDFAEEAADSLGRYGIEAPMEQAVGLSEVLVRATREVAAALRALRQDGDLAGHLVTVHQIENEGDRLVRDGVAALFQGGIDPMVVIRWKDIFESLEQAIDACETVANVLEGIGLRGGRRR